MGISPKRQQLEDQLFELEAGVTLDLLAAKILHKKPDVWSASLAACTHLIETYDKPVVRRWTLTWNRKTLWYDGEVSNRNIRSSKGKLKVSGVEAFGTAPTPAAALLKALCMWKLRVK